VGYGLELEFCRDSGVGLGLGGLSFIRGLGFEGADLFAPVRRAAAVFGPAIGVEFYGAVGALVCFFVGIDLGLTRAAQSEGFGGLFRRERVRGFGRPFGCVKD